MDFSKCDFTARNDSSVIVKSSGDISFENLKNDKSSEKSLAIDRVCLTFTEGGSDIIGLRFCRMSPF